MAIKYNPFTNNLDYEGSGGGGGGDVVGPASSTENAIARFADTTGKVIENSLAILADTGAISISNSVDAPFGSSWTNSSTNVSSGIQHIYQCTTASGFGCQTRVGDGTVSASYGFDGSTSTAFTISAGTNLNSNRVINISVNRQFQSRGGNVYFPTAVSTTPFVVLAAHTVLEVQTSVSAMTVTLTPTNYLGGQYWYIFDVSGNAAANNITIDTSDAKTINGANDITISTNYGGVMIYYNGTNYFVL